ncbi:MAG: hypothetical protein AAGE84_23410, partial [Cyanobacteria bacterium P01_G01_bin.39]
RVWNIPFFCFALFGFLRQISVNNFVYLIFCWLISFFVYFYYVNKKNTPRKLEVLSYLKKYDQCRFIKTPYTDILEIFTLYYLPPFGRIPKKLKIKALNLYLNVIKVEVKPSKEKVKKPGTLNSFPSPSGHHTYIFVPDDIKKMKGIQYFFLLHEIAHGCGIANATYTRKSTKFFPVLVSLLWIIFQVKISITFIIFYIFVVSLAVYIHFFEIKKLNTKLNYYAEITADYIACRHLSSDLAQKLLQRLSRGRKVIFPDKNLSDTENIKRVENFKEMLNIVVDYGVDKIDIPEEYMLSIVYPGNIFLVFSILFLSLTFFYNLSYTSIFTSLFVLFIYGFLYVKNIIFNAALDGIISRYLEKPHNIKN